MRRSTFYRFFVADSPPDSFPIHWEPDAVRRAGLNASMIKAERAAHIEERLAALLDVEQDDLRDYLAGNIRAGGARRTGIRFVRGTNSGSYVRDPDGTDVLPAGYSIPA